MIIISCIIIYPASMYTTRFFHSTIMEMEKWHLFFFSIIHSERSLLEWVTPSLVDSPPLGPHALLLLLTFTSFLVLNVTRNLHWSRWDNICRRLWAHFLWRWIEEEVKSFHKKCWVAKCVLSLLKNYILTNLTIHQRQDGTVR